VRSFVGELQGVGDAVEHALGDTGHVPALESDVVLGRDSAEGGDLLATQALDPTGATVGPQPCLLGGDARPTGGQELLDVGTRLLLVDHGLDRTRATRG